MKHTIEDERTRGLKRQVWGEAYLLTAALLLVSCSGRPTAWGCR